MSNAIQLNHQKDNVYEFDLEIEGVKSLDIQAWLVIFLDGMELAFKCTQKNKHFTCDIPPIPFVERTAYKGAIRFVADDYFFEPVSNLVVDITGNVSFDHSDIKNMTMQPANNKKEKAKPISESKEPKKSNVEEIERKKVRDKAEKPVTTSKDTEQKRNPIPKIKDADAPVNESSANQSAIVRKIIEDLRLENEAQAIKTPATTNRPAFTKESATSTADRLLKESGVPVKNIVKAKQSITEAANIVDVNGLPPNDDVLKSILNEFKKPTEPTIVNHTVYRKKTSR